MHDGLDTERIEYEKRQQQMEVICNKIEVDEKLSNEEINFFLNEIANYLIYELTDDFKQMKEEKREYSVEMLRNFFGKNRSEWIRAHYAINKMAREHIDAHKNLIMSMRNDFREALRCPKNSYLILLIKERDLLREFYYCRRNFYHDNAKHLKDNRFIYNEFVPVSNDNLMRIGEIQEDIQILRKVS